MSGTKMPPSDDDKKFIPVMNNISSLVPQDETIVTSEYFGNMVFFVNRTLLFPHGASSNVSSSWYLPSYMVKKNFTYLMVFENFSRVEDLKDLFSLTGLKNLKTHFTELGDYATDKYRFHLYKIRNNHTFSNG